MGGTQGFSTWAFTWTLTTTGSATIMARGVDDSLNQESPVSTSVTVVAGGAAQSLWPNNPTPSIVTVNDPNAVELGVNFQSSQAGGVLGIRFYKGPQNRRTPARMSARYGTPVETCLDRSRSAAKPLQAGSK
jgi:Domain of unknown function (DUF4082)